MGGSPKSATTQKGVNNSHTPAPPFIHPHKKREDFDSNEEYWFYHWLGEALRAGLIGGWNYHKQSFMLAGRKTIRVPDPVKTNPNRKKNKFLLHPQEYTPDFVFGIKKDFMDKIGYKAKIYPVNHELYSIIIVDVKGKYAGKYNNSAVTFPILQKWLCDKQDVLVNKLVPENFFRKTWVPMKVAFSPNGKRYKKWKDYKIHEDVSIDLTVTMSK